MWVLVTEKVNGQEKIAEKHTQGQLGWWCHIIHQLSTVLAFVNILKEKNHKAAKTKSHK